MSTVTPKEIVKSAAKAATEKGNYCFKKTMTLSFLAGVYISMGSLLAILFGYGFPGVAAENPAIIKMLMGAAFPVGLMLVVLAGGELFTGNTAYFIPSVLNGEQKWTKMFKNWSLVWIGNFIGSLFFAYFLVHLVGVLGGENSPWSNGVISIAEDKTSHSFLVTFLKGIGANWLVCLAMWLGISSKSTSGKIIGIWFPVMTFVAIGYEHSIANMFFIPLAMMQGADITTSQLLLDNLLPSTLGNIVGGSFFVGMLYWYVYNKLDKQKNTNNNRPKERNTANPKERAKTRLPERGPIKITEKKTDVKNIKESVKKSSEESVEDAEKIEKAKNNRNRNRNRNRKKNSANTEENTSENAEVKNYPKVEQIEK